MYKIHFEIKKREPKHIEFSVQERAPQSIEFKVEEKEPVKLIITKDLKLDFITR